MKRLTDYQGDEAIELWADLLEPVGKIIADKEIRERYKKEKSKIKLVQGILKKHKREAVEILQRIDPAPVTALNVVTRLIDLVKEIEQSPDISDFFTSAGAGKTQNGSFGSATVNTGAEEA